MGPYGVRRVLIGPCHCVSVTGGAGGEPTSRKHPAVAGPRTAAVIQSLSESIPMTWSTIPASIVLSSSPAPNLSVSVRGRNGCDRTVMGHTQDRWTGL